MRRAEKEVFGEAIIEIIKKSEICRLAFYDHALNTPYVVPMNFGFEREEDGLKLYFHCAKSGRKFDCLRLDNRVCFEMDTETKLVKAEKACRFSQKFSSVIGFGKIFELTGYEEKRRGLASLMAKYDGANHAFSDEEVDSVAVLVLNIDEITGKRN